jgi:membrane fusion protein, multidrug efflux system
MTQPLYHRRMPRTATITWTASLFLVATLLVGCKGDSDGSKAAAGEDAGSGIPVEVVALERGDVFAVYTGTASLETDNDALVVAKVGGQVVKVFVEEGDRVEAGQVLARLDGDRLRLEMERSLANLRKLEQEHNRSVQLFERGLVSSGAFEDQKYELEALRAIYRLAQLEYSYTEIKAPISGVVVHRYIRLGNTVSVNDAAFQITELDPLIAYIHIPEREFRRLETGQAAELSLDAIPGQRFQARVQRISPVVDPATGTFKVTMEVPDQGGRLKPGMFGRFNIVWDRRENVLLVPRIAIGDDEAMESVFVVTEGKAERRAVRTGYTRGSQVEIIDGLSGDEEVVVIGQSGLRDGVRVDVVRRADTRVARDGA